jgi:hypothetical protein
MIDDTLVKPRESVILLLEYLIRCHFTIHISSLSHIKTDRNETPKIMFYSITFTLYRTSPLDSMHSVLL